MKRLLVVFLFALGAITGCNNNAGAPPAITITFAQGAAQAIDQGQSGSVKKIHLEGSLLTRPTSLEMFSTGRANLSR
jgi:hypothetical protein